tara:strand:+ start:778 stop:1206 length:429 start_codon:yes stop_codon:yes gene_type:complete
MMRENVYITVTLVVLMTSIIVFFSQEFGKTGRKIFSIPGAKLFLPLVLASIIIELNEPLIYWLMLRLKENYHAFTRYLSSATGFSVPFVDIFLIFLITMFPIVLLRLWEIRRNMPESRPITTHIGVFIWVILAIVLIGYEMN